MFRKLVYFITRTAVHKVLINFQEKINTWEEDGIPLTYHNLNVELNRWINKFGAEAPLTDL